MVHAGDSPDADIRRNDDDESPPARTHPARSGAADDP
jgi:hypothetical protein